MPPDPRVQDEEDEDYESSQDSDFAPEDDHDATTQVSDDDDANSDDDSAKRKRAAVDDQADDAGFENSGDEAIITKGIKKRRKRKDRTDKQGGPEAHEGGEGGEDGGEGGLIKTRSMRAQEKAERKVAAVSGPVTVDVDALWAQMITSPTAAPPPPIITTASSDAATSSHEPDGDKMDVDPSRARTTTTTTTAAAEDPDTSMIRIKRTYNFAGKVHTEEKLVPRDSAEAKLHLASLKDGEDASASAASLEADAAPTRRALKKAFRSAFEPVLADLGSSAGGGRADLNLGVGARMKARADADGAATAKKLTTVEKSRMDWAGFVDREGLKDELELAGRAKGSYNEREGFLARSEARREEDAYKARTAAARAGA